MKWQLFCILATSHRLPSNKHLYLPTCCAHHCPSRKSAPWSCRQEFSLQRCRGDSLCNGHDCIRDAEQWPKWLHILLMSRGVWRCSCFGRGWYFLLVSWSTWKTHSTPMAVCLQTGYRMRISALPVITSSQGNLIHQSVKFQIYWKSVYIILKQ